MTSPSFGRKNQPFTTVHLLFLQPPWKLPYISGYKSLVSTSEKQHAEMGQQRRWNNTALCCVIITTNYPPTSSTPNCYKLMIFFSQEKATWNWGLTNMRSWPIYGVKNSFGQVAGSTRLTPVPIYIRQDAWSFMHTKKKKINLCTDRLQYWNSFPSTGIAYTDGRFPWGAVHSARENIWQRPESASCRTRNYSGSSSACHKSVSSTQLCKAK